MGSSTWYRLLVKDEDAHEDWREVFGFRAMSSWEIKFWKDVSKNLEIVHKQSEEVARIQEYKDIIRHSGLSWML